MPEFKSSTYTVIRHLGKGSFGDVYLATNRQTGQDVVIKVSLVPESLPQFIQEHRILARFHSPLIAATHRMEIGNEEEPTILELEFVTGKPLQELEPPPADLLDQLVLQLLTAVRYLHRVGYIHGDLTLENVFWSGERIQLIDFGLAQPLNHLSHRRSGTPIYMAPEQLQDQPASEATDLYAAGVLILSLILGRFPFAEEPDVLFAQKLSGEIPWDDVSGCSDWCLLVMQRLLDLDPEVRLTIDELLVPLEQNLPLELRLASRPAFLDSHPMVPVLREELETNPSGLKVLTAPKGSGRKWILKQLLTEDNNRYEWRILDKITTLREVFQRLAGQIQQLDKPIPTGPISDLLKGSYQTEDYSLLTYAALAWLQDNYPGRIYTLIIEDAFEDEAESRRLRELLIPVVDQLQIKVFWLSTTSEEGITLPLPQPQFLEQMLAGGTHITPAKRDIVKEIVRLGATHLGRVWQLFHLNVMEERLVSSTGEWKWQGEPLVLDSLVDYYKRVLDALGEPEKQALALIGTQAPGISSPQQDQLLASCSLADHPAELRLQSLLRHDPRAGMNLESEIILTLLDDKLLLQAHQRWYDFLREQFPEASSAIAYHLIERKIGPEMITEALEVARATIKTVNYSLAEQLLDHLTGIVDTAGMNIILELQFTIALDRGELETAWNLVEQSLKQDYSQKNLDRKLHLATLIQGPQAGLEILQQELEPLIADTADARFSYLCRLAYQYLLLGDTAQVNSVLVEIEQKKEQLEWSSDLISPMNTLATVYYHQHKLELAGEIWEKLLESATLTTNQDLLFRNNLAVIRIRTARDQEALALLMQVNNQARKHHLVVLEQQSGTNIALLKLHQGRIAEAEEALTRCLQLAEITGDREMIRNSHHNLGEALVAAGKTTIAREELKAALPGDPETGLTVDNAETLLLLASLHLDFNQVDQAGQYLDQLSQLNITPESSLEYALLQELLATRCENRDQELLQITAALTALRTEEPDGLETKRLALRQRLLAGTPLLESLQEITEDIRSLGTLQERQELLALAASKLPPERRDFSGFDNEMNFTVPGLINLQLCFLQAEALHATGDSASAGVQLSEAVQLARTLVEQLPPDWQQNFLATNLPGRIKQLGMIVRNELENE